MQETCDGWGTLQRREGVNLEMLVSQSEREREIERERGEREERERKREREREREREKPGGKLIVKKKIM